MATKGNRGKKTPLHVVFNLWGQILYGHGCGRGMVLVLVVVLTYCYYSCYGQCFLAHVGRLSLEPNGSQQQPIVVHSLGDHTLVLFAPHRMFDPSTMGGSQSPSGGAG